jgi:hypothetical protein
MMSTDSISSGLNVPKRLTRMELKLLAAGELSKRMPSTMISGSLVSESELAPRMRMELEAPVCPVPWITCTPAVRAWSSSLTLVIGTLPTSESALMVATTFPNDFFSTSPVAVVITSDSCMTDLAIAISTLTSPPAGTTTSRDVLV